MLHHSSLCMGCKFMDWIAVSLYLRLCFHERSFHPFIKNKKKNGTYIAGRKGPFFLFCLYKKKDGGEGGGGAESSAAAASPNGKRGRDPEDEVYLDNFHAHKRYLSEIMASSLNGLSVGDSLPENLMESPARSESIRCPRDEIASQYSPMSEDSDDSRYFENLLNTTTAQSDVMNSSTSPVSPHRHQKPAMFSSSNPHPLPSCTLASVVCSHPCHRGSDSEGRFPSSPNDVCHMADHGRAALLRSVQMRAQPHCPPARALPFGGGQENVQSVEEEEDQSFSCI